MEETQARLARLAPVDWHIAKQPRNEAVFRADDGEVLFSNEYDDPPDSGLDGETDRSLWAPIGQIRYGETTTLTSFVGRPARAAIRHLASSMLAASGVLIDVTTHRGRAAAPA